MANKSPKDFTAKVFLSVFSLTNTISRVQRKSVVQLAIRANFSYYVLAQRHFK